VPLHPRRHDKYTLLLAVSSSRVVGYQVLQGSANSQTYASFVSQLQMDHSYQHTHLLMDNVAFHKSKVVKDALAARNLTALYSPPYSPEYNPVEMAFSVFKAHMRATTPASDATDKPAMLAHMCDRVARCAVSLSPSKLAAMFRHVWQLMSAHAT
jgi:transposase